MKLVAVRTKIGWAAELNLTKAPPGSGYPLIDLEMVRFWTAVLALLLTNMPVSNTSVPLKSVQKYST
jgi:hypothetical protein